MSSGLILKNICKRFGEFETLIDIRAGVEAGKITAFIGPNGAGKTTLLNIIAGAIKPDSGTITFNGIEITGRPAYAIAQLGIGRQFQNACVFKGMSVMDNVMVAAFPESVQWTGNVWFKQKEMAEALSLARSKALHWLDYVGLADQQSRIAGDLSFGQQKMVSLARLFAHKFKVLLLDEPTAGLDYKMVEQIVFIIRKAVQEQGLTVVIVEHNMSVVTELAYWIHFMHEGRIAFSGQREHVLGNRSVREIYMGL